MGLKDDLLNNLGAESNLLGKEQLPWEIEGETDKSSAVQNKSDKCDGVDMFMQNNSSSNLIKNLLSKITNTENNNKNKLVLGISALLIFCVGFGIYSFTNSQNSMTISHESEESENSSYSEITVHVGGAVNKPGVYKLNRTQRLMDAVNAAGGLTENADSDQVNLAKVLEDGEQIIIPSKTTSSSSESSSSEPSSTSSQNGKININTADLAQLQTLSGVGPSTAQKIIDYRNANGKFKSIDEIKKVSGIGEKTFAKFSDKICV